MNELEKGQSDDSRTRQYEYRRGYAAAIEDVVKLCESGCLKGCDSYGHEDLCPYVNTLDAIKALLSRGSR